MVVNPSVLRLVLVVMVMVVVVSPAGGGHVGLLGGEQAAKRGGEKCIKASKRTSPVGGGVLRIGSHVHYGSTILTLYTS